MIGKKKLSEIRSDVLDACSKAGMDPASWLEEQIRVLEHKPSPQPVEIETLKLIRDALKTERSGERRSTKRVRTR